MIFASLLAVLLLSALSFGQTTATQDAEALEAQYKTCAKGPRQFRSPG
jgi:hypothetical protein